LSDTVVIRNHQRAVAVNGRQLLRLTRTLLHDLLGKQDVFLEVHLLARKEMTRLNETFLGHRGPTDVIAFDYREAAPQAPGFESQSVRNRRCREIRTGQPGTPIHGELFICLAEAVAQARRFRTSWPAELARYLIHGVLHLDGFDDAQPGKRRRMKREEDRLLRELRRRGALSELVRRGS
jgi:probable rRNA maturation factor